MPGQTPDVATVVQPGQVRAEGGGDFQRSAVFRRWQRAAPPVANRIDQAARRVDELDLAGRVAQPERARVPPAGERYDRDVGSDGPGPAVFVRTNPTASRDEYGELTG